jgi:iron complex transport system substrate-binding protein
MLKNTFFGLATLIVVSSVSSCNIDTQASTALADSARIVSLNGTVSEILVELGMENNIVGVDVASTYPASLADIPRVGHSRQIAAEGVLALGPDAVIATSRDVKPEVAEQIRNAGVQLYLFDHDYSIEGTKKMIRSMADSLGREQEAEATLMRLEKDLEQAGPADQTAEKPKVLFIYARGTGTMMVAGKETPVDEMIKLAGGQNAVSDFSDFKPLTAEALVAANPDVILMFDSGLSSLGGVEQLLEVQGIAQTNAGKNKKIVEMDGQLLTGFSPRLGKAIRELSAKIH